MAKLTLLQLVNSTLSTTLDLDPVSSINDTIESSQVADISRDTYFELISEFDWPHVKQYGELEALSDVNRPNMIKIPTQVSKIEEIYYDISLEDDADKTLRKLIYKEPKDFIDLTNLNKSGDSNVIEVDPGTSVTLFIRNDIAPTYWTTFDNELIVTDSYNSDEDTTLQESKSQVLYYKTPDWTESDSFIPDLDEKLFPTFLAEVKRRSSLLLRQSPSIIDEQSARRGKAIFRHEAERYDRTDRKARYGRR